MRFFATYSEKSTSAWEDRLNRAFGSYGEMPAGRTPRATESTLTNFRRLRKKRHAAPLELGSRQGMPEHGKDDRQRGQERADRRECHADLRDLVGSD